MSTVAVSTAAAGGILRLAGQRQYSSSRRASRCRRHPHRHHHHHHHHLGRDHERRGLSRIQCLPSPSSSPSLDSSAASDAAPSAAIPSTEAAAAAETLASARVKNSVVIREERKSGDGGAEAEVLRIEIAASALGWGEEGVTWTMETGRIARQASGAVLATAGDGSDMLLATACRAHSGYEDVGAFVPLQVQYMERHSAAGLIPGNFLKREGRPRDGEILTARLIDRPLRPLFEVGFSQEVQVATTVLSLSGSSDIEPFAITASSTALLVSDIPLKRSVAAVRVCMIDGELVVNPPQEKRGGGVDMDIIIAGTAQAILMIEGYANFVSEQTLLEAVAIGQKLITEISTGIDAWAARVGKEVSFDQENINRQLASANRAISALTAAVGGDVAVASRIVSKTERGEALDAIRRRTFSMLLQGGDDVAADSREPTIGEDEIEEPMDSVAFDQPELSAAFKAVMSTAMRDMLLQEQRRSDGRRPEEIRPISSAVSLQPMAHGSAIFTRGETQAICTSTLAGESYELREDAASGEIRKRFYLMYTFPPYSVGECGRFGAPGRREIGHGNLAERALMATIPSADEFPYTIKVESLITESNGSSSMASVCGGCLALMDAGVPIKKMVAGVAMGLVLPPPPAKAVILSDILGSEDALGDMDFKVAGGYDGITAVQMDIKVEGITLEIMAAALDSALAGRRHILAEMQRTMSQSREQVSPRAPQILHMKIAAKEKGKLIGRGGENIKKLIETSGVDGIDVDDSGNVAITGQAKAVTMAESLIKEMFIKPEVGQVYPGSLVKKVIAYGAFLEVIPGVEGFIHISEIKHERVEKMEDVLKAGDKLDVKCILIDDSGRVKLSHKALLPPPPPPPPSDSSSDGGSSSSSSSNNSSPGENSEGGGRRSSSPRGNRSSTPSSGRPRPERKSRSETNPPKRIEN